MNVIIWLAVGGLLGWTASVLLGIEQRRAIAFNVAVGIIGAFVGGWLFSGLVGTASIYQAGFSAGGLVVSVLGAVTLLAFARAARLA